MAGEDAKRQQGENRVRCFGGVAIGGHCRLPNSLIDLFRLVKI